MKIFQVLIKMAIFLLMLIIGKNILDINKTIGTIILTGTVALPLWWTFLKNRIKKWWVLLPAWLVPIHVLLILKVSTLVIIRRMLDLGHLTSGEYWEMYHREEDKLRRLPKRNGGNFFLTQAARTSKRFTRALIISTLEGHTLHRDALRYLGLTKTETFHKLGQSLGVV